MTGSSGGGGDGSGWCAPVCNAPPCGIHGTCVGPNKCECELGYGGVQCDDCPKHAPDSSFLQGVYNTDGTASVAIEASASFDFSDNDNTSPSPWKRFGAAVAAAGRTFVLDGYNPCSPLAICHRVEGDNSRDTNATTLSIAEMFGRRVNATDVRVVTAVHPLPYKHMIADDPSSEATLPLTDITIIVNSNGGGDLKMRRAGSVSFISADTSAVLTATKNAVAAASRAHREANAAAARAADAGIIVGSTALPILPLQLPLFPSGGVGCVCPEGYTGDGINCTPVCEQLCLQGICVAPGVCKCNQVEVATSGVVKKTMIDAWTGEDCGQCVQGAHGCHEHASCYSLSRGEVRCICNSGYTGDGVESCAPVCYRDCVHGTCAEPGKCFCDRTKDANGKSTNLPAWSGELCTDCVQGVHLCHEHATCSSVSSQLRCTCNEGWSGNGKTCKPQCPNVDCGDHGKCVGPDECGCDLGWTGKECETDCGCNFHSTCSNGVGKCDECQHYTGGLSCNHCAADAWGLTHHSCTPCTCNGHGTCDAITGVCDCTGSTEGRYCDRCLAGLAGNARDGGQCYHACEKDTNRVLVTKSEGALSSGQPVVCSSGGNSGGPSCHRVQHACLFIIRPFYDAEAKLAEIHTKSSGGRVGDSGINSGSNLDGDDLTTVAPLVSTSASTNPSPTAFADSGGSETITSTTVSSTTVSRSSTTTTETTTRSTTTTTMTTRTAQNNNNDKNNSVVPESEVMRVITLEFDEFEFECAFDVVRVYNGPSFASPLLGVFSGLEKPPLLRSRSKEGMMLHMYSDYNWALSGFKARYRVEDCPDNCFSAITNSSVKREQHGLCNRRTATCECFDGWEGEACEKEVCLDQCGVAVGHGICVNDANNNISSTSEKLQRQWCRCNLGWTGDDCSTRVEKGKLYSMPGGVTMPSPRTQHATAYRPGKVRFPPNTTSAGGANDTTGNTNTSTTTTTPSNEGDGNVVEHSDELWVFGGREQEHPTEPTTTLWGDLMVYSFARNAWSRPITTVAGTQPEEAADFGADPNADANTDTFANAGNATSNSSKIDVQGPPPRYGHTAVHYNGTLIVFGGRLDAGKNTVQDISNGHGSTSSTKTTTTTPTTSFSHEANNNEEKFGGGADDVGGQTNIDNVGGIWKFPHPGKPANDVWILNMQTLVWTQFSANNGASLRAPNGDHNSGGAGADSYGGVRATTEAPVSTAANNTDGSVGNGGDDRGKNNITSTLNGTSSGNITRRSTTTTTTASTSSSPSTPPPLLPLAVFGHTATIAKGSMYVFGGLTPEGTLAWQFLRLDLKTMDWKKRGCSTSGNFPGGLYGHSTVYAESIDSLIVYGGRGRVRLVDGLISSTRRRFAYHKASTHDRLWIYSLTTKTWRRGTSPTAIPTPVAGFGGMQRATRALHTAAVLGRHMIVLGGSPFQHETDRRCYSTDILVYDVDCDEWLENDDPHIIALRESAPPIGTGATAVIRLPSVAVMPTVTISASSSTTTGTTTAEANSSSLPNQNMSDRNSFGGNSEPVVVEIAPELWVLGGFQGRASSRAWFMEPLPPHEILPVNRTEERDNGTNSDANFDETRQRCSKACEDEFVNKCITFWANELQLPANQSDRAFIRCKENLSQSKGPLAKVCVSDCLFTDGMLARSKGNQSNGHDGSDKVSDNDANGVYGDEDGAIPQPQCKKMNDARVVSTEDRCNALPTCGLCTSEVDIVRVAPNKQNKTNATNSNTAYIRKTVAVCAWQYSTTGLSRGVAGDCVAIQGLTDAELESADQPVFGSITISPASCDRCGERPSCSACMAANFEDDEDEERNLDDNENDANHDDVVDGSSSIDNDDIDTAASTPSRTTTTMKLSSTTSTTENTLTPDATLGINSTSTPSFLTTVTSSTTIQKHPQCGWYEKHPFRFRFCYADTSAVADVQQATMPSDGGGGVGGDDDILTNGDDVINIVSAKAAAVATCSEPCMARDDCNTCVHTMGCIWCPGEQTCVPNDMFAFQHAEGQCTSRSPITDQHRCPVDCSKMSSCSSCFEHAHCGWCLDSTTGIGKCSEGDYGGSMDGTSQCFQSSLFSQSRVSSPAMSGKRRKRRWKDHLQASKSAKQEHNQQDQDQDRATFFSEWNSQRSPRAGPADDSSPVLDTDDDGSLGSSDNYTTKFPSTTTATTTSTLELSYTWLFFVCPNVNECASVETNNCHTNAVCTDVIATYTPGDTPSYSCTCNEGYEGDGRNCVPTCQKYGCDLQRGVCAAPDECQCKLGWTSLDCSVNCGCHGHSNCVPIKGPPWKKCTRCEHNTTGTNCEFCATGYHGDATQGASDDCVPCKDVCNGNSELCLAAPVPNFDTCDKCAGNTYGSFCESCVDGFFMNQDKASQGTKQRPRVECIPCDCNGNGNQCDPISGENCRCTPESFSFTDLERSQKVDASKKQCSFCKEGYAAPFRLSDGGSDGEDEAAWWTTVLGDTELEVGDPCYTKIQANAATLLAPLGAFATTAATDADANADANADTDDDSLFARYSFGSDILRYDGGDSIDDDEKTETFGSLEKRVLRSTGGTGAVHMQLQPTKFFEGPTVILLEVLPNNQTANISSNDNSVGGNGNGDGDSDSDARMNAASEVLVFVAKMPTHSLTSAGCDVDSDRICAVFRCSASFGCVQLSARAANATSTVTISSATTVTVPLQSTAKDGNINGSSTSGSTTSTHTSETTTTTTTVTKTTMPTKTRSTTLPSTTTTAATTTGTTLKGNSDEGGERTHGGLQKVVLPCHLFSPFEPLHITLYAIGASSRDFLNPDADLGETQPSAVVMLRIIEGNADNEGEHEEEAGQSGQPFLRGLNRSVNTLIAVSNNKNDNGRDKESSSCAMCRFCDNPCEPGKFRDPDQPHLCIPCQCNNHGDVCQSSTGSFCGMAADGCNTTTGENCDCAHNTKNDLKKECSLSCTRDLKGAIPLGGCHACQCAICANGNTYSAPPTGGKQCYTSLNIKTFKETSLDAGQFHAYHTDVNSGLDYSNVDVRIVIEVWEGNISATSSLSGDWMLELPPPMPFTSSNNDNMTSKQSANSTSSVTTALSKSRTVAFTEATLVQQRKEGITLYTVLPIPYTLFKAPGDVVTGEDHGFFLLIEAHADTKYTVKLVQSLLEINLFVFFSVFFSCFFLFFAVLAVVSEGRLRMARRDLEQRAEMELHLLSQRPMASIRMFLHSFTERLAPGHLQDEKEPTTVVVADAAEISNVADVDVPAVELAPSRAVIPVGSKEKDALVSVGAVGSDKNDEEDEKKRNKQIEDLQQQLRQHNRVQLVPQMHKVTSSSDTTGSGSDSHDVAVVATKDYDDDEGGSSGRVVSHHRGSSESAQTKTAETSFSTASETAPTASALILGGHFECCKDPRLIQCTRCYAEVCRTCRTGPRFITAKRKPMAQDATQYHTHCNSNSNSNSDTDTDTDQEENIALYGSGVTVTAAEQCVSSAGEGGGRVWVAHVCAWPCNLSPSC